MKNAVKILPLADCKAHIPTLADWFTAKWQPYYGAGGPGDARGDLAACCNRDALPMALVALVGEAELAGTAALKN